MDEAFVFALDDLRALTGFPLAVSSGYRCPTHNDNVSSTGRTGPHTTGCAADFLVYGAQAAALLSRLPEVGITGTGLSQASSTLHKDRFVHVDTLDEAPGRPRPWVWTY